MKDMITPEMLELSERIKFYKRYVSKEYDVSKCIHPSERKFAVRTVAKRYMSAVVEVSPDFVVVFVADKGTFYLQLHEVYCGSDGARLHLMENIPPMRGFLLWQDAVKMQKEKSNTESIDFITGAVWGKLIRSNTTVRTSLKSWGINMQVLKGDLSLVTVLTRARQYIDSRRAKCVNKG